MSNNKGSEQQEITRQCPRVRVPHFKTVIFDIRERWQSYATSGRG